MCRGMVGRFRPRYSSHGDASKTRMNQRCAHLVTHVLAGGFGPMLATLSQYSQGMPLHGTFIPAFTAAVTANIGAWASLSLNISDFTRFAKTQRDQGDLFLLALISRMSAPSFTDSLACV